MVCVYVQLVLVRQVPFKEPQQAYPRLSIPQGVAVPHELNQGPVSVLVWEEGLEERLAIHVL